MRNLKALPLYIVGDSHVLPYKNMARSFDTPPTLAFARTRYISGFAAGDFYDGETGGFLADFVDFLEHEGLTRNGLAVHMSDDPVDMSVIRSSGQAAVPPLLMIVAGDIDIRNVLMPMFRDGHDFIAPFDTAMPEPGRPLLPWDLVEEQIRARVAPLVNGVNALIEAGFTHTFVQAVVPPTADDQRIEALHGFRCPASLRSRLVRAFNRLLVHETKRVNGLVVDAGAQFADPESGAVRPEFEVDGVHLPPSAVQAYFDSMLNQAIDTQWLSTNHAYYDYHYRFARAAFLAQKGAE